MSHILPAVAHGDRLPVVKAGPKYEGRGENRRLIGSELTALLPFDNLTAVPIVIPGLDAATLPSPETIGEHNQRLNLLLGKFQGLVIEFSGGDFGTVRYKGRASSVTFENLSMSGSNAAGGK